MKLFSYTFLIKLIAQSKFYADLHFEHNFNCGIPLELWFRLKIKEVRDSVVAVERF